ncbi:MAG: M28 family peptidase, partial [Bacteroidales bacterium]
LFAGAPTKYADLKAKAAAGEPLPSFTITGVKVTVNVDTDYQVASTQRSRNVVGIIRGSDPAVNHTYVVFGAHYDHLGYQPAAPQPRPAGQGRGGQQAAPLPGHERRTPDPGDRVSNGADDDGSGSAALLALAKAYMNGPRPKRSLMFVWFCGEERGMWGSHYAADFGPTSDKVAAELNIDMIGRNEWDQADQVNNVFIIGSDRISTELHNINVDANAAMTKPLKLDYEFNDPTDTNQFYFRSDHYSYAGNGVPIIFYTTGEHRDYHQVTDEVKYIEWEKYARIVQLIHDTGLRVANMNHLPVRDNKGPRAGKGTTGKIATN